MIPGLGLLVFLDFRTLDPCDFGVNGARLDEGGSAKDSVQDSSDWILDSRD